MLKGSKSASWYCLQHCNWWSPATCISVSTWWEQFCISARQQAHTQFKSCFLEGRSAEADHQVYFTFIFEQQAGRRLAVGHDKPCQSSSFSRYPRSVIGFHFRYLVEAIHQIYNNMRPVFLTRLLFYQQIARRIECCCPKDGFCRQNSSLAPRV